MNSVYFSARFHSSAADPRDCPPATREVAFAGRSNAGKSSAINCITRRQKLARTSKTPGRTQLINHFTITDDCYLVDLPGYGYAQVSRSKQKQWRLAMTRYLVSRKSLQGVVLVVDIRRPLTDADWQLIDLQQQAQVQLHLVLTKSDKLSRNQAAASVMQAQKQLSEAGVDATLQPFSALKKTGIDDLHLVLDHWLFDKPLPED
ncbi:MAG: ribosome biogenesis GTP-binding protein YihA/YsxC [Granulosicoccus sp.]|nr:ribosome biogenesis GTP-binding protein YihA/YsxC [Granulosicoccus sp.]